MYKLSLNFDPKFELHLEKRMIHLFFLQFCDELRDDICLDLGVNLRDDDKVLFVFGDPVQLRKEIQLQRTQQQQQQKEKEIEKLKNQIGQIQKDIENWEKKKNQSERNV